RSHGGSGGIAKGVDHSSARSIAAGSTRLLATRPAGSSSGRARRTVLAAVPSVRRSGMDPRAQLLIRYAGAFARDVAASASGSFVQTTDGRRLLDFTAGQICATIGHNHPRVVAAIQDACRSVLHLNAWTLSEPVLALA